MRAGLPDWARKRFDTAGRYGLRVTLFALATLLVLIPFLYLLLQVTSEGPLTRTDTEVAEAVHRTVKDSPPLVMAAKVVSFLGVPAWFYLIIGTAAIFFWRRGGKRIAIYLVVTNLVGGALDTIVKISVNRPRPELEDPIVHAFGKSFPSGHAMASTVGYGTLLLVFMPIIPRRWRIPAVIAYLIWISLMCMSRLSLGVHFVSDVLGGVVLGLAWLAAGTAAFSIWRKEEGRKPVEVLEGAEPEAYRTTAG
jgi:membrane-associated phospholipid phosphatase